MNGYYSKRFFGQNRFIVGNKLSLDAGNPLSYPGIGINWYDLSGSNNNGTLINGVVCNGRDMVFDGVNDYVNIGNVLNFERTQQFTLNAWINPTDLAVYRAFIAKMEVARGYYASVESLGEMVFIFRSSTGNRIFVKTINSVITPNTWSNCVITYDGSSSANGVNLYVNGVLITKIITENTLTDTTINNANLQISSRPQGDALFRGSINDVNIYNYALTAQQVLDNFNALRGKYGI